EVFGVYAAERADLLATPAGAWRGPVVQIDPKLFNRPPPPDTPFAPYAAAQLGQFWIAAAGWSDNAKPAGLLLGPQPGTKTPPRAAGPGERLDWEIMTAWPGTWIDQTQLIDGQQPWNTVPLVLAKDNPCLAAWRKAAGWLAACW